MILARAHINGEPHLILGLEGGNIERLKDGQPIYQDLGLVKMEGRVLILFGETKGHIVAELERAGFQITEGGVQ